MGCSAGYRVSTVSVQLWNPPALLGGRTSTCIKLFIPPHRNSSFVRHCVSDPQSDCASTEYVVPQWILSEFLLLAPHYLLPRTPGNYPLGPLLAYAL